MCSSDLAKAIMEFPRLRKILATDVEAAYEGDPAAMSHGEIISVLTASFLMQEDVSEAVRSRM